MFFKVSRINFISYIPFVVLFTIYLAFLSGDIYGGDVGDLVTASAVGGVAHPPGYPLFTLLGYLFSKVFFFLPAVKAVGIISALSSTLATLIFFSISYEFIKNRIIAYISALILSFSYLFWLYSEIAEVFALNNLLALGLFYCAYRFYRTRKIMFFYLQFLVLGLGMSNHHTIIFLLPGVFVLISGNLKILLRPAIFTKAIMAFVVGLLPYLYVLVASYYNPIINWNGEPTLTNLLNLFTRKIYGTLQATPFSSTSIDEKWVIFTTYLGALISNISIPVLIIAILGMIFTLQKNKRIFLALITIFVITGPFFSVYAAFPLINTFNIAVSERFYILSYVFLLLFIPFGVLSIINISKIFFLNKFYPQVFLFAFFFIPLLFFIKNNSRVNLSRLDVASNYSRNLLMLPSNSLILLSGDTALFNTWYVQNVLHVRPDIKAVWHGGLTGSSYFVDEKNRFDENINDKSKLSFWKYLLLKKRIYSNSQISIKDNDLEWVPKGLSYELTYKKDRKKKDDYLREIDLIWNKYYLPDFEDLKAHQMNQTTMSNYNEYSKAYTSTGVYLMLTYNEATRSASYFEKAIVANSSNAQAYAAYAMSISGFDPNSCNKAYKYLRNAIYFDPFFSYAYVGIIEERCQGKVIDFEFKKKFVEKFNMPVEILEQKMRNDTKRKDETNN